MLILTIDTVSDFCATSLVEGEHIVANSCDPIGKGHAEHLIPQIAAIMHQSGKTMCDIDRISVNAGPGSFTGIRVGVAAARGLALALNKPAIAIDSFSAFAFEARKLYPDRPIRVIFSTSYDKFYKQDFDSQNFDSKGQNIHAPSIETRQTILDHLPKGAILTGPCAQMIAETVTIPDLLTVTKPIACSQTYAILASLRPIGAPVTPLYIREANAKPKSDMNLTRKRF